MKTETTRLEPFSAGYFLAPEVDVIEYGGDDVVISNQMYDDLFEAVGEPVFRLTDGHFWPRGEAAVMSQTVAVPEDVLHYNTDAVLVAKPGISGPTLHETDA